MHLIQTKRNLNILNGHRSGKSLLQPPSILDTNHSIRSGPTMRCVRHRFSASRDSQPLTSISVDFRYLYMKGFVLDTVHAEDGPYEPFDDISELPDRIADLKLPRNRVAIALRRHCS
jgi:hypothetical protein